jgi:hypothetical protein
MARRGPDGGLGDLLGVGSGVDMGVGDEERPVLQDHQAERADRMQLLSVPQHLRT